MATASGQLKFDQVFAPEEVLSFAHEMRTDPNYIHISVRKSFIGAKHYISFTYNLEPGNEAVTEFVRTARKALQKRFGGSAIKKRSITWSITPSIVM